MSWLERKKDELEPLHSFLDEMKQHSRITFLDVIAFRAGSLGVRYG